MDAALADSSVGSMSLHDAPERLLVEEADGTVTITLNRPDTGNVLDLPMARDLVTALADAKAKPGLRLVVLRAEGRRFSVGGDLKAMTDPRTVAAEVGELLTHLAQVVSHLHDMPAPTLAVVAGTAAGGGLSLALACDVVLCTDEARLVPAYGKLGASPDAGMSWQLARRTSLRWALDFLLLSDGIDGARAARDGLVTRSVPSADLPAEEASIRARLLSQSPDAVLSTRRLLAAAPARTLPQQMAAERESFLHLTSTAGFAERVAALTRR